MVPKKIFLTKGTGVHKNKLFSFELALRDAGIEGCNLVPVSSIFPPGCKLIDKEEGIKYLEDGAVTHCVMAKKQTDKDELISSAIGLSFIRGVNCHGYLFENCASGSKTKKCGDEAQDLSCEMLMTRLAGLNQQPAQKPDVLKTNTCQTAKGKKGVWTTVLAVAVFINQ